MEKAKKEALTQANIIEDLSRAERAYRRSANNRHLSLMYPFFFLFTVLLVATRNALVGLISALPMLYFLVRIVLTHAESAKQQRFIRNGEFTVEHMTLTEFSTERIFQPNFGRSRGSVLLRSTLRSEENPSPFEDILYLTVLVMQFSSKRWRIPAMHNFYKWSDRYVLTYQGLDNTSVPGDEFIVVTRKSDSQIGMVYNTKFFEWKQEK